MGAAGLAVAPAVASEAVPACSIRTAAAAIKQPELRNRALWQESASQIANVSVLHVGCADVTGDGRDDMVVTTLLAGRLHYVEWLVFRATVGGRWLPLRFDDPRGVGEAISRHYAVRQYYTTRRYTVYLTREALRLSFASGAIVERVRQPRSKEDAECCPRGGYATRSYRYQRGLLRQISGPYLGTIG